MSNQQRTLSINLGFLKGISRQLKLIGRLMIDGRVSPLVKLLPVGAVIYWIVPTDLMPGLPFDDAAVLYMAGHFFLELCPHDVVQEHLRAIDADGSDPLTGEASAAPAAEVIDAEFHDVSSPRQP